MMGGTEKEKMAVLVIDMLNEYLDPKGKVYCAPCRDIIPNVQKLIEFGRKKKFPAIYVNTSFQSEDKPLAKKWGFYAQKGTWGAEVIPQLKPAIMISS